MNVYSVVKVLEVLSLDNQLGNLQGKIKRFSKNFLLFLLILILGPVIVRLVYEASLMLVMIWKNTKQISDNTSPKAKEDKKEVEKKETEKKSTKKDEN